MQYDKNARQASGFKSDGSVFMKFFQYDYILAVAEERSFTKAAKKLFIAQPSLSQYVMSVEKELGVELFDRGSSPIRLTDAGRLFIDTAYQIMSLQDQLVNQINDITNLKIGHFIVGMTAFRTSCILPHTLASYKQRWPDIRVGLVTGLTSELGNYAREGRLDIFITIESELNKNLFDFEPIAAEKIILAVPPDSPMNKTLAQYRISMDDIMNNCLTPPDVKPVPLSLFKDEIFVCVGQSQNLYIITSEMCRRAGFEPRILLHNRSVESIFAMTVAGLGISFMPTTYIKYANIARHAAYYCIDDDLTERNLVVAYKKKHYLPHSCKEFISTMKRTIQ